MILIARYIFVKTKEVFEYHKKLRIFDHRMNEITLKKKTRFRRE